MISSIQDKLQKHNKTVFGVLLAIIIVAFVFTIGNIPGIGFGDRPPEALTYFGYNLNSPREGREAIRHAATSYRMEYGDAQVDGGRLQNYLLDRIAFLELADRLRIPPPTEEQMQHFIMGRAAFQNEQGIYDPTKYSDFIDEIDADPQLSVGEVAWVMEQDYRVEKARELLSGPGYVLPAEVRQQLERNRTLWSLDLATLNLAEFEPEIEVTDEQLQQFFEENSFRYEREPQISFSYAVFPNNAFIDEVGDLAEEEVIAHFEANRGQFTPPEQPKAEPDEAADADQEPADEQPAEITLADVRDQVEASLRRRKARRLAGEAAADFAYEIFRTGTQPGSAEFEQLLTAHQGELRETPPVSPSDFPFELGFSREAREAVMRLSEDRQFSDPLPLGADDYMVLIYHETLPAFIPPLEEVAEDVERDYREEERRRLLSERGEEIRQQLAQRISEGATFIEAAEAEGLTTQSADQFSRISPPEQINRQIVMRLDEFERNEVSPMITLQNFGYFIYLKDREVPEITADDEEFVRTADNLRDWSAMSGRYYVMEEFIARESGTPTHTHEDGSSHTGHAH